MNKKSFLTSIAVLAATLENSFQFFPLTRVALPSAKNTHAFIINKIEIDFGKF